MAAAANTLSTDLSAELQRARAAEDPGGQTDIPLMPVGQALDMGQQADGTPLFDPRVLHSYEFQRNPYPYYRILRDHYPLYHNKLHNTFYVTRYEDVWRSYFDDEGFNTIPKGSSSGVLGNTQLELSGVEHRRRRNLYGQHLVGRNLNLRVPSIQRLAREMIADWDQQVGQEHIVQQGNTRTVELGRAFANEFPIRVVCEVLGFPKEAQQQFYYWYNSMMSGLGGSQTHKQGLEARQDLEDYVASLVEVRRREPSYLFDEQGKQLGKDIITKLCETRIDGDYLSTEEITSNIALLVAAGGETTRGAIVNLWYLLLQHRDQFEALAANSEHWDRAFHETLRHSSPIGGQPRHNTYDLTMHGLSVPAGSLMEMVDFSANHDDRVFKDPETFDIFRDDLYSGKLLRSGYQKEGRCSHMAFGVGPHLCPGAWISHQEAVEGSKVLLEALGDVRIAEDRMAKDEVEPDKLRPIGIMGVRNLWVEYQTR
ncbi:MAG: cytochrome P450 [Pseudomonadales bacterium]